MMKTIHISSAIVLAMALLLSSLFAGVQFAYAASDNASSVESYTEGTQKDGDPVDPSRTDPNKALGASDGDFVSLGYEGELILGFDQSMSGSLSLSVHETTFSSFPEETAEVAVSQNSTGPWTVVGTADNDGGTGDGITTFENIEECFQYVRIIDTTNEDLHNANSDGFDVDSVSVEYDEPCTPEEPEEPAPVCPLHEKTYESDTDTQVIDDSATEVTAHENWTASIPGASWIWKSGSTADNEIVAFEEDIHVSGTVHSAILDIASDNSYAVFIDGVQVAADNSGNNFTADTQDTHDLTSDLTPGNHTLRIEVMNNGVFDEENNPGGLMYLLVVEAEKCPKPVDNDDTVKNYNYGKVVNTTSSSASTGGNYAGGSEGGNGGNGGDIENSGGEQDVDDSSTGNGGNGGNGDQGGTVISGNAYASASTVNVVNSNTTRINRCACDGDDNGDVNVRNRNVGKVYNYTGASARTGYNAASGSEGGNGGNGGEIENDNGDDQDVEDTNTGRGGNGGSGGLGGFVESGEAVSTAHTLNTVNRNTTRIRR